jgi:hypothetical protein
MKNRGRFSNNPTVTFTLKSPARPQVDSEATRREQNAPRGRIPRASRLMALAIKFDGLIRNGHVKDYAELARLGFATRGRITQIMNLLLLAPDIQEDILFLSPVTAGKDPITEHHLRQLSQISFWNRQRKLWGDMKQRVPNR